MEEEKRGEELKGEEEQKETAETVEEAEETSEKEEKTAEEAAETVVEEEVAAPVEEEEAKPSAPEEKAEEEEFVEERIYTIPLSKAWIVPPKKRAPKAIRIIRSFVTKHMKLEARKEGEEEETPKRLFISNEVNERVWKRGIEKPCRNIRIRAARDKEGNVTVYLAEGD
ncbi:60S ribosomal protein L31 [Candidatus Bathyarchaeota archaeon]|nr:60S ribosomal protein L31 [Candidatus Bathyarchaeota archaeon]